jgi:hypothetical protein
MQCQECKDDKPLTYHSRDGKFKSVCAECIVKNHSDISLDAINRNEKPATRIPQPLFVDGPLKGRSDFELPEETVRGERFRYASDGGAQAIQTATSVLMPQGDTVEYHLHRFGLLGHRLLLWSTKTSFQDIAFTDLKDLFEILISDRGKAAEDF